MGRDEVGAAACRHLRGDARPAQRIIDGTPGLALRPQARNYACTIEPARHAVLPTPAIQWQSSQSIEDDTASVSYTHLRAHETRHDLVCRLLLEKKKKK